MTRFLLGCGLVATVWVAACADWSSNGKTFKCDPATGADCPPDSGYTDSGVREVRASFNSGGTDLNPTTPGGYQIREGRFQPGDGLDGGSYSIRKGHF